MAKNRLEAGRGKGQGVVKGGGNPRKFYLILAGAAVAGVAILAYMASSSASQRVTKADVTPIANQGHVLGNESAPVEVVEYADFECPACGNFANLTEPDVRARLVNTGIIRFRFMDFPLDMHPNARTAHMAAWCAGDQGKFWEMHDLIFQNQDRWSTQVNRRPASFMEGLAQQAGLDMSSYNSCMDSRKFAPQIEANYAEAVRRGIPSTPTFVIGGKQINGAISYDQLKGYVDEALATGPRQPGRQDSLRLEVPRESASPR